MHTLNPEKIKLAFLGGGIHSAVGRTHKIASEMDGLFTVETGCFSRDPHRNRESAEYYKVGRYYDSYEEMLEGERGCIDAVVVLTPTPQHAPEVIRALEAGYHVICDKSLAISSEEALEIERKREEGDRFLAVTYNYTGYPMVRELRQMVKAGRLGEVLQIHVEMPQETFLRKTPEKKPLKPQPWRLRDVVVPTLSLDLAEHLQHLVSFLIDAEPLEAIGVNSRFGAFKDVVDNTIATIRYERGIVCGMWYSKSALGERNGLKVRIYGSHGAATWYQMEPEVIRLADGIGNIALVDRASPDIQIANEARYNRFKAGHPAGLIEAFANYYVDIARMLETREADVPYVFGTKTAIAGLKLLEAIERSTRTGRWEKIGHD